MLTCYLHDRDLVLQCDRVEVFMVAHEGFHGDLLLPVGVSE